MKARLQESSRIENQLRIQQAGAVEIPQADVGEATEAGIIEFPKEKKDPNAGKQKKELRLDLKPERKNSGHDSDDFVELPAPLVDRQSINLKRRKRGKDREVTEEEAKFNKKFKKIKTARDQAIIAEKMSNQFDSLGVGDSSGEDEGDRRMPVKKSYKQDAGRMKGRKNSSIFC